MNWGQIVSKPPHLPHTKPHTDCHHLNWTKLLSEVGPVAVGGLIPVMWSLASFSMLLWNNSRHIQPLTLPFLSEGFFPSVPINSSSRQSFWYLPSLITRCITTRHLGDLYRHLDNSTQTPLRVCVETLCLPLINFCLLIHILVNACFYLTIRRMTILVFSDIKWPLCC